MGHRDIATPQIYADYAPSPGEAAAVEAAFRGIDQGSNLSEPERTSADLRSPVTHQAPERTTGLVFAPSIAHLRKPR